MNKRKGLFRSFRVTLVLSVLVGIIVPVSMIGNFEGAAKWKMLVLIGLLSFALFWAIAFTGWILVALVARGLGRKSRS